MRALFNEVDTTKETRRVAIDGISEGKSRVLSSTRASNVVAPHGVKNLCRIAWRALNIVLAVGACMEIIGLVNRSHADPIVSASQIRVGMNETEVERALGTPNSVVTRWIGKVASRQMESYSEYVLPGRRLDVYWSESVVDKGGRTVVRVEMLSDRLRP